MGRCVILARNMRTKDSKQKDPLSKEIKQQEKEDKAVERVLKRFYKAVNTGKASDYDNFVDYVYGGIWDSHSPIDAEILAHTICDIACKYIEEK